MKTPLIIAPLFLASLALLPPAANAQSVQTQVAQATPAVETKPGETYQLKHRSSFTADQAHNPFWPIGWVKGAVVAGAVAQENDVPITSDSFTVTSISIGTTPLAVINGKTYGEGETISAVYGGQRIKIQVTAITDGTVILQYLNKKYVIALKHPELQSKAAPPQEYEPRTDSTMILH